MASGPVTVWQIEEEKVELVTDFFFLASKINTDCDFNHEIRRQLLLGRKAVTCFLFLGSEITAVGDCSHEIRRQLLLGRKGMTNLDSILKIRDITLLTKAVVFPVVTYSCESRTIKKADRKSVV